MSNPDGTADPMISAREIAERTKFCAVANCLLELAIENRALWKLVSSFKTPSAMVGFNEREAARKDFEVLESEIKSALTTNDVYLKLPKLLGSLTKRIAEP
jgi:hypothetical protein